MNNQPMISIIVPLFNTEKFIKRCLESIEVQTYTNLEVIIVDDGSTDKSIEIVQEFANRDNRYKVIRHESNLGLFKARITGLRAAKGDYFAFIDSDDHVSIDYYRLLIAKALSSDADIIIADFADEYEDGKLEYYNYDNVRFRDISLIGGNVYDTFMKQHGIWFGWHTVWNKLYKRTIWEKSSKHLTEFSKISGRLVMTEDIAFSSVYWRYAQKVVNVHNVLYFYYHHSQQSVCNSNFEKFASNLKDVARVFEFLKSFLIEEKLFDKYQADFEDFLDLYIEFWTGNANAMPQANRQMAINLILELFGKTIENNYKDHFHYTKRTELKTFYWYENIKKDICSKDINVISFDIFDTLVLRPFFYPSDLFMLLNEDFNKICKSASYVDFSKFRTEAETHLRKKYLHAKEVTIDDIYNYIQEIFELSDEQKHCIENLEKFLEVRFARPRQCGKELYELAKLTGKRIVFTSDIYLDSKTVSAILKKCGYEADQLYLSSDYLEQKSTGSLFNVVITEEKTNGDSILHIGDNWNADIENAKKYGVRTHYLPSPITQFKNENIGIYTGNSFVKIFGPSGKQYMGESALSFLGIRCMLALAANKIFDNPYLVPFSTFSDFNSNPYYIGYYALGMHLYAVTDWIKDIVIKEKRDTVHFVSRDGYLPMKAFEIIKKFEGIETNTNYLYISRKASALFQNTSIADFLSYLGSFYAFSKIRVNTVRNTISTLVKDKSKKQFMNAKKLIDKNGYSYSCYGKCIDFDDACRFGKYIYNEVMDSEKIESINSSAAKYFSNIIKDNDIVFDLGYRANKEHILSSLIARPIDCLYVYTNESTAMARALNRGFSLRTFYDYTPTVLAAAREILFSELAPSCVSYDYLNNMEPIFDDEYKEHYFNYFAIKTMQEGALDFIYDFESTFNHTIIPKLFRHFDASLPYEYFLNYSPKYDREILGCVTFEDDTYAGKSFSLMDHWEQTMDYHKLNHSEGIPTPNDRVINKNIETQTDSQNKIVVPDDTLIAKFIQFIDKRYPKGSKKRDRLRKFIKFFIRH